MTDRYVNVRHGIYIPSVTAVLGNRVLCNEIGMEEDRGDWLTISIPGQLSDPSLRRELRDALREFNLEESGIRSGSVVSDVRLPG